VLLAQPRSFCAGVEMAIKALAWMVRTFEPPVFCYHEIVHNRRVVDQFRRAGVVFVDDIDEVPPGAPLMLSAHGSAPEVVRAAHERSRHVVDAVCPLVKKVHHEVRIRSDKGHAIVYAGHAAHDEAIGTLAVSPAVTHLVEQPGDVGDLDPFDGPVAFLAQTTLGVDEWQSILAATRQRYRDVWVPGRSDLCFATTNRQQALKAVAPRADAVVVIGSASSSNTLALVRVAQAAVRPGTPVVRVDGPDELPGDLRGVVGVTAGASAAEEVVESVVERLGPRRGIEVIDVTIEDEYFPPPRDLRDMLRTLGCDDQLDDDAELSASDVLAALADQVPIGAAHAAGTSGPTGSVSTVRGTSAAEVVAEQLGAYSFRVDRQIAEVLEHEIVEPWLRSAIEYHLGWLDERFEPPATPSSRAGGKKLRATLAVLAYQAASGRAPDDAVEPVVPFAAAVELIHNWSLVHDDIEDGDRTRRGRPALWTIVGEAQAINVGDCVFALAFRCLGRLRQQGVPEDQVSHLLSELARTAVDITVGQMRDLTYETTTDVTGDRYESMIECKTAALISCATYGGALLGSGDRDEAEAFGDFGHQLGVGFQMRDDILGIWGTDAETGKPTGGDIRRRKKSLPVVLGFEHAGPDDGARLRRLYAASTPVTPDDERFVRGVLDGCGIRDRAQQSAERHCAEAVAALDRAALAAVSPRRAVDDRPFAALRALADFVTHRTY
jgi:4-hydroxy-3-methylbut-2-enyl diphosphate reductase